MQQHLKYKAPQHRWGPAVTYVKIDKAGKMWVGNDEYETQVNYCPFTGVQAPTQMITVDRTDHKLYVNEKQV